MAKPKKPYSLIGVDGNAHAVMGYVRRAMMRSGYSREEAKAYLGDCMSGSYEELLSKSMDKLDEINSKLGFDDDGYGRPEA